MLPANRLDGLTTIGLPEDADNFFGAVEFVFHGHFRLVVAPPKPIKQGPTDDL